LVSSSFIVAELTHIEGGIAERSKRTNVRRTLLVTGYTRSVLSLPLFCVLFC